MADVLVQALADRNVPISLDEALEIVAAQFGVDALNSSAARVDTATDADAPDVALKPPIPIFRIFDVGKAMEFYRDFLGFHVDWEHRFGDDFPLYCQVSRGNLIIHLSEHAGDASPGAKAFVWMSGIRALHAELTAKRYTYMKPGLKQAPCGLEMTVIDPFSNRIAFCEKP
jgi:hypothetical protein